MAAWNGEFFARQDRLRGSHIREVLPRRGHVNPDATVQAKKAQLLLFIDGHNKRMAAANG